MRQDDSHTTRELIERRLRYYLTAPGPCPYVEGKIERKAFTHLSVHNSDALHTGLSLVGFRRSQAIAYRPACPSCSACQSVRVRVKDFDLGRRWRRVLKRNGQVERSPVHAVATDEQFELFRKYLRSRHRNEGMSDMTFEDYASMVESSPVRTLLFEYRLKDELVAVTLTDILRDGFSLVYSFFDPDYQRDSVGSFVILDHVCYAAKLELPHVYLGYWIEQSAKMAYKRDFGPLEVLNNTRWEPLDLI